MRLYDDQNIFARILRGEAAIQQKIYENDQALAFPDLFPKAPIHVLIIPKGPYMNYHDFYGRAQLEEIMGFSKAVTQVIETLKLKDKGYRLMTNCGVTGGQEVPHFHLHLLSGRPLGPLVCEP